LRWVSRFAVATRAEDLGDLTLSVLRGDEGRQRKEIAKLVQWLKDDVRPEIVVLTGVLLSGLAPRLRRDLGVPVLAMLQGDDIFLEALPAAMRSPAKDLIRANCESLQGYLATSRFYADFMAEYLGLPRSQIDVVYPGINLEGHGGVRAERPGPFTIGYFARICPEKGLHVLIEAFRLLKQMSATPPCRLLVSGWLGEHHRAYFDEQQRRLADADLLGDFDHTESPDHAGKVRFLQRCDVLSVPTVYREPKGLYILEAWANGVPVVQPRHGTFPELIEATGGGVLVNPEDPADLAQALRRLMEQPEAARALGRSGQAAVRSRFHAAAMAEATVHVLERHLAGELARRG
jgi:glycosyltransferase involved in cell wall biosynthesis